MNQNLMSIAGIAAILAIAFLLSSNRKAIRLRVVGAAFALQATIAWLVLWTTTGAGDLFAAGFLAARCRARSLERCLEAGAQAAAEVISHFGARPEANLKDLVQL